jgi:hypothetical protein
MGAGSVCLQQQDRHNEVKVGREEEGVNSLRPELAALARRLQATPAGTDLLYLCDSETTLDKVSGGQAEARELHWQLMPKQTS